MYKDFIQRYTELIGAIQLQERTCDGRLSTFVCSFVDFIRNLH